MDELDNALKEYRFSGLVEKPINEFSNWMFGISVGICSLLLVDMNNSCVHQSFLDKSLNIFVIFVSLANCIFSGYCKYLIFLRDIGINKAHGQLKKIITFGKLNNQTQSEDKLEFDKEYNNWVTEYNKIGGIAKKIKCSTYLTLFTVTITAVFIIYLNL